jgi:hypothetical protein
MLVEKYRLGRLDLDGFVSERIGIEDIEPAFEKMPAGRVLRSVVEINARHGTGRRRLMTAERTDATGKVRVGHLVTSGTFSLDGASWDVDNNVGIIGDARECIIIDPSPRRRRRRTGGRRAHSGIPFADPLRGGRGWVRPTVGRG